MTSSGITQIESKACSTKAASDKYHCWAPQRLLARSRWFEYYLTAPRTRGTKEGGAVRADYVLRTIRDDLTEARRWQAIDRLSRRLLASEAIQHPGIVPVLDAEVDRPPFFLIEPFLPGRSLNSDSSNVESLSLSIWILRQVAEIMSACHDADRVHLGVEPNHILVSHEGKVSVTGWSNSHQSGQRIWLPTESASDVWSRAPEVGTAGYRANPAADVYAWGVMAYWMFTGERPHDGGSLEFIQQSHRSHIPVDLQVLQPRCPGALNQIVMHCLAKHPLRRPQSKHLLDCLISIEIDHLHDQQSLRRSPSGGRTVSKSSLRTAS